MSSILSILNRKFAVILIALASIILSSCGDSEPTERKAFIEYMQKNVLSRKGSFVPYPNDKEKAAFGRYAEHYQVITNFTDNLDTVMEDYKKYTTVAGKYKTMQGIQDNWKEIEELRSSITKDMGASLQKQLEQAQKARAELQQPEDLKAVYDQTFEKLISTPAEAVTKILPVIDSALEATVNLGRFLDENREKVTLTGSMIQAKDPSINNKVTELIQNLNTNGAEAAKAANELMKQLSGR